MGAAEPLSEEDLVAARTELAAGRQFQVWFTTAAVGVPAGGSAKVVAVDEVGEGDFIQVKRTGSRDTMFCSPNELTRTRPPRKKAQRGSPPASREEPQPAAVRNGRAENSPGHASPQERPAPGQEEKGPEKTPATTAKKPARVAAEKAVPEKAVPEKAPEKPPARSRSVGSRAGARPAEVTLTLSSSSEGEWTVEVTVGKKRAVRPTPVPPGDVATAARALPAAVVEAIESSLEAARQRQVERVEQLRAELDAAQRALQELRGRS